MTDARWAESIVRTLAAWCVVASVAAYLAVVGLAIAVSGKGPEEAVVQGPAAGAAAAAAAIVATVGVRRRVAPLFEAVEWGVALARARWAALGFTEIPETGVGLEALASRSDEPAMAGRAAALAALGRADELEALLDGWAADTPTAAAAIARHRVNLDALRGRIADPAAALEAASRIPDRAARVNATALVHVDIATREARAGRSPEAALQAVRQVAVGGPSDVPVPRPRHLGLMTLWLTIVGCAVPVAVACLLAAGVVGLAVWVGVVAIVVVGSRRRYRARVQRR